ncbi:hypothetical protein SCP_0212430 [Sparassis crispa]|uniref:Uncharacterized protein n=1 Tax=Sparassis crispa TaxID=139825 RepID=A0A401GD25_9APHY|nr:hypothetical protein SCP_0212430 [Sparassis crispa]GBE80041.1 hypothetical protein SCP_0212430 [Sparassis crispa]
MEDANTTENGMVARKQKTAMLVVQVSDHQMRIEVLEGEKELLRMEMESFKTVAETYEKRLETAIDQLDKQARLIGGLQDLASELQDRLEATKEASSEGEDELDEGFDKKEKMRIAASAAALRDASYRELVWQAFQTRMGVPNLKPRTLPFWPKDGESMPVDPATKTDLMRFRWDQPWDAAGNYKNIRTLVTMIIKQGAELVPGAAKPIRDLLKSDAEESVKKKFRALQKALRDEKLIGARGRSVMVQRDMNAMAYEDNDSAEAGGNGAVKDMPITAKKSTRTTSRAKGKLQVHIRKRTNLPKESKWRDPKYDAAFTMNLMSDDEDQVDEKGEFTGKYISKAPAYRSQELINLFRAVDAAQDPKPPNRYIPRMKAAETIDEPPKVSRDLKNKARHWMIDQAWLALENNKQYDVESRIVNNGHLWGDEEDPQDITEKQKRMQEAKAEITSNKKARLAESAGNKGKGSSKKKIVKKIKTVKEKEKEVAAEDDDSDDLYFG